MELNPARSAVLSILLSVFFSLFLHAQEPGVYAENDFLYEKIYLHVDREFYTQREMVWFKIYLVSGINNQPLGGFKNVYVELVNDTGLVMDDRLILASNGTASGDFQLHYSLPDGTYTIRAYTKYMKQYGEQSIFHKKIFVSSDIRRQQESNTDSVDLAFYPSGGSLLRNTLNVVGFRGTNNAGRGINLRGYILNDLGDTITPFATSFNGMGKFLLMPEKERDYFAVLEGYPDYKYHFDNIREGSVSFYFEDQGATVRLIVSRSLTNQSEENFLVNVSHKGIHLFTESLKMTAFQKELVISKNRFPLGISRISVENETGDPLAGRLVFIQAGFNDLVKVSTDKQSYGNREKVVMTLESLLPENDSVPGGLSVSVVNKGYLTRRGYSKDMRGYLLLESDLSKLVETPAAYFNDAGMPASDKLDLLMLTQGMHSYIWPQIRQVDSKSLKGWDDVGLTISGQLRKYFRDQPLAGGSVRLGPFTSAFLYEDTISDENGRFEFNRLYLRDSTRLMLEAKNRRDLKFVEIRMDPLFRPNNLLPGEVNDYTLAPEIPTLFFAESFSKQEAERRYAINSGTYWIEEVEIVEEAPVSLADFIAPEMKSIYGLPDNSIKVSYEDGIYMNVFDYLSANPVAGVVVTGNEIMIRGGQQPLYMIDGIEVSVEQVETLPMADIDVIDIVKNAFGMAAMGSRGADGVISIYTKMGSYSTFDRSIPGRVMLNISGFQWPRAFHSPKYPLDEDGDPEKPDYRPTLYWDPEVMTSGQTDTVTFFTSDYHLDYLVIVEGISARGKIISGFADFSVGRH